MTLILQKRNYLQPELLPLYGIVTLVRCFPLSGPLKSVENSVRSSPV